ncbi:MAG TPA: hypothetical protein DEA08_39420 [Planctomycetes bacterium]|nr:hypothetical protein [Planctomycetota bacterium]
MGMIEGYRSAAKLTRSRIAASRPEDLEHLSQTQVVVVRGCYDQGGQVFDLCQIPATRIQAEQVAAARFNPDQILFVNCPGDIDARGLAKIESFVAQGGMLVTTDWALTNVIERVFPGTIAYNRRATGDDVVRVAFEEVEDPFLEGLLDENDDPLWWLEGSSYPIKVLDPRVRVLVSSREMAEKYGEAPIVVAFEVGEGIVYHLTSHFYLQRTETRTARHQAGAGAYASQKGVSLSAAELSDPTSFAGSSLTEVQSAYTSARSLSNLVISQGRRVSSRKG